MSEKYQLYSSWVVLIETDGVNLNKWETDFVQSIGEQLERNKQRDEPLTERQAEILERIYAEKTK